jgi:uncharacterized surface protein with fasciclin (FAS1) repeats
MKKIALALVLLLAAPAALAQFGLPNAKAIEKKAKAEAEKKAKAEADKQAKDAKAEADKQAKAVKAEAQAALKVDVVDTAVATGKFTTLATALQAADLITALKGPGPFTVFAPDDAAFAKVPAADLTALLADKDKLTAVLKAHVVAGKVLAKDVKAGKVKTLAGTEIDVVVKDGKVTFGGANVTKTDIDATNGVIHVIDTVVLP